MTMRRKLNLAVIALVALGMPAYYKTKYLLLGQISFAEVFHWTGLVDIAFAGSLAAAVLATHDFVVRSLRARFGPDLTPGRRVGVQVLATTLCSIAVVAVYTWFFFTALFPSAIPNDFLFEMFLLGLFLPVLVSGIQQSFYYYGEWERTTLEREHLEKENLRAQYRMLQHQLNPHFLFNCLNTLSELIEESQQWARDFVLRLSGVYRFVLENQDQDLVELDEELRLLDSYLFLVKARFGDTLKVRLGLREEDRGLHLVPMTLQMLLENALKHNVASAEHPLEIHIAVDEGPRLVFRNNVRKKKSTRSTGLGLENLAARYRFVAGADLEVDETPARFTVTLPLVPAHP